MGPILITPFDFDYNLNKYGCNIKKEDARSDNSIKSPNTIFFVGGLADSCTRALFNHFAKFNNNDFSKFYATFDAVPHIPNILQENNYIVAHSWGASSIIKTLANVNKNIKYLLTLDSVAYTKPNPITCVSYWENIYIKNHFSFDPANIVALVGHPQGYIKFANNNIALGRPNTHTSIRNMLKASKYSYLFS